MVRAYIYLISFKNTDDIYIGKTKNNIEKRFKQHTHDILVMLVRMFVII